MTNRNKVKTIRAANGFYRYLLLRHQCPFLVSKAHHRTVGDAKSAGKAKARLLALVGDQVIIQTRGLCIECLYRGFERQAVRRNNAHHTRRLCRRCHQNRNPRRVARSGTA